MFAALQWMGARSEQGLSQVAATQHLALAQDGESEMAAGRTALVPFEGLKLSVVQETPLLHRPSLAVRLYYSRSEGIGIGFRLPL